LLAEWPKYCTEDSTLTYPIYSKWVEMLVRALVRLSKKLAASFYINARMSIMKYENFIMKLLRIKLAKLKTGQHF